MVRGKQAFSPPPSPPNAPHIDPLCKTIFVIFGKYIGNYKKLCSLRHSIQNHVVFAKLHSDLRILTQLQLVGVEVDFVFPLEEGRKELPTPSF